MAHVMQLVKFILEFKGNPTNIYTVQLIQSTLQVQSIALFTPSAVLVITIFIYGMHDTDTAVCITTSYNRVYRPFN